MKEPQHTCSMIHGAGEVGLRYGAVLGRQVNHKESSKSKELAELRLQVLVVVKNESCL